MCSLCLVYSAILLVFTSSPWSAAADAGYAMKRAPFFGGMASSVLGLSLVLLSSLMPAVHAQMYTRDWTVQVVNGVSTLQWRPTVNDPWYVYLACTSAYFASEIPSS